MVIRRRALHHGDVPCGLRERWHERDSGRARADDGNRAAVVVEVARPVLGMHHGAREVGLARQGRVEPASVAVVPDSEVDVVAGHRDCATMRHEAQGPVVRRAVPGRLFEVVLEVYEGEQLELGDGFLEVGADSGSRGDGFGPRPRFEAEPERVHVAVGADTGKPEQVPGAADAGPHLKDGGAQVGPGAAQLHRRGNPRNTRADDGDVHVLRCLENVHVDPSMMIALRFALAPSPLRGVKPRYVPLASKARRCCRCAMRLWVLAATNRTCLTVL